MQGDTVQVSIRLCLLAGLCMTIAAVGIAVVMALVLRNRNARGPALSRDTDRTAPRHCRICDVDLPPDAPQGLCPRCLLHIAIDEPPPPVPSSPSTAPYQSGVAAMTPAELASHFPQLEIMELLGKGGMGAVYMARQPHLDRFVALKVLPPETARDPAFAERFAREARALARLNHPNIVGVHDFGQQGGLYYLMMEYVDGVNLRQAMRAGQLTPEDALRIVPQLCDALQFAHDEGIVHRDIKPENILLDRRGRVKVADFGLAKMLGQSAEGANLTGTQQVMGTLHYMAPEQVAGAHAVDHRADIYALGVTFYEMLTGQLPLGRFPLPSKKAAIDPRLDHVVLRTLEHEPAERYQHASDVKTEVESIVHTPPADDSALNIAVPGAGLEQHPHARPDTMYLSLRWVGGPIIVLSVVNLLATAAAIVGPLAAGQNVVIGWMTFAPLICSFPIVLMVAFAVIHLVWSFRRQLARRRRAEQSRAPLGPLVPRMNSANSHRFALGRSMVAGYLRWVGIPTFALLCTCGLLLAVAFATHASEEIAVAIIATGILAAVLLNAVWVLWRFASRKWSSRH
jgi:predicted Ser/Thr protein kinase